MTLEDLLVARDKAQSDCLASPGDREKFSVFVRADDKAAFAMARLNVFHAKIGSTFYERYNNSVTARRDIPEASTLNIEDD